MTEKQSIVCLACGQQSTDDHHIAGRANDPTLTVPVCGACHRGLHRDLEEAGVRLGRYAPRNVVEKIVAILRALAQFFLTLGQRLHHLAEALAAWFERLRGALCPTCLETLESLN